jgi:hypothetical protein
MGDEEEIYHLTPKVILGSTYNEVQRYMLLLKDSWKLGPDGTVAVVLEDGQLHFRELQLASPVKGDKKKKNKKKK